MDKCDFFLGTTTNWVYLKMHIMFKKTMEFCNKGMVRADPPPPPVMVKDHKITIFLGPIPKSKKC